MFDAVILNFKADWFDVAVTALKRRMRFDYNFKEEKPALTVLSAGELWKHGRTPGETCPVFRSHCTAIKHFKT